MWDFAKSALWPVVALVALCMFFMPIRGLLNNISNASGYINRFKIGDLEVSVDAKSFPNIDEEDARIVLRLDRKMLTQLLSIDSESSGYCFSGDLMSDDRFIAIKGLEGLGIVSVQPNAQINEWCKQPHTVIITQSGRGLRENIINIIYAQLRNSRYVPS